MSHSRIYISNLSFDATESDLYNFLEEFKVISVLIPSQTIRGLSNHAVRPFGIAYAEFECEEDAEKVIQELNGKQFMERTLHIRKHIPIDSSKIKVVRKVPAKENAKKHRFSPFRKSTEQNDSEKDNVVERQGESTNNLNATNASEPVVTSQENSNLETKPTSENIAFIGFLPRNTTDEQLREYFKEFSPAEIIVFKNRMFRRGFSLHRHFTGALITFNDDKQLEKAKLFATDNKFRGKIIVVKNAYLEKIKEVKKALEKRIANSSADEDPEKGKQSSYVPESEQLGSEDNVDCTNSEPQNN